MPLIARKWDFFGSSTDADSVFKIVAGGKAHVGCDSGSSALCEARYENTQYAVALWHGQTNQADQYVRVGLDTGMFGAVLRTTAVDGSDINGIGVIFNFSPTEGLNIQLFRLAPAGALTAIGGLNREDITSIPGTLIVVSLYDCGGAMWIRFEAEDQPTGVRTILWAYEIMATTDPNYLADGKSGLLAATVNLTWDITEFTAGQLLGGIF